MRTSRARKKVHGSSDRSFGLVMAAFFAIVALLPLLHGPLSSIRWWALAVAAVFLVARLAVDRAAAPAQSLWLKLGLLLSKVVSPIVLMLLFYVTVTPIGLLMRATGKDPLRLRRDARGKKLLDSPRAARTGARVDETAVLRCACCRFCENSGCFCGSARNTG